MSSLRGSVDHKTNMSKLKNVNCSKCKMRLFGEWSIMPTYHALSFLYLVSVCEHLLNARESLLSAREPHLVHESLFVFGSPFDVYI